MNALIDTHAFLWYALGNARLPALTRSTIEDSQNTIFISVASLWEVSIKVRLGKLSLGQPLPDFFTEQVDESDFTILPIERSHLLTLATLPLYHRDPFDRLIVAQSIAESMPLITGDASIKQYPVTTLW